MFDKTKNYLLIKKFIVVCLMIAIGLLVFSPVYAGFDITNTGLGVTAKSSGLIENAASPNINTIPVIIGYVVGALLSLLGVLFLILIIYGGILWMMAGGNAETIKKAGAILRNAAIGLIIVIAAYAIVNYVLVELLINAIKTTAG